MPAPAVCRFPGLKLPEAAPDGAPNRDPLTGLPDRTELHDRLAQALAFSAVAGRCAFALLIDLDRFKRINGSLGHARGDRVLAEAACRLSSAVRGYDLVARFGGDQFAVLVTEGASRDNAAALARRMLHAVSQPFEIDGGEYFLTASVGIGMYPDDGLDGQALIQNADAAMHRAKSAGRGVYRFYAASMNDGMLRRLGIESRLQRALERNEFVLHYQPQIDFETGRIAGIEALLRWAPDGRRMVPPEDFIPIAEECGLIVPIGEWALRAACRQARLWREAGYAFGRMAVNLSARQFKHPGMEEMIGNVLQDTGCAAGSLELEITESVHMEEPDAAARLMGRLSDLGVHLSIDDFGTGFSCLASLRRYPVHGLKIDRSFVRGIACDAGDAAVAQTIIALGHSLGLQVVAEGVETAAQAEVLRAQRCDIMQGFLYSEPVPAVEVEALFEAQDKPWAGWKEAWRLHAPNAAAVA